MQRRALAMSALGLVCLSACAKHGAAAKPMTSAGASSPSASPPSASAAPSVAHLLKVRPGCRALAVTGKATVDGTPLVTGMLLDGEHWVKLDAGASVALRHTLTSRELALIGPGLVLPCRHGAEQVLLAEGKLSTSSGLGVRPGAEVLIAAASGTIHYGDAAIDVEYGPKGLRLLVKEGEAWMEPENEGLPRFKNPVRGPKLVALPADHAGASALAEACQASAERAAEAARGVLRAGAPEPQSSLGARAAAHIRGRAAARAACSMAAAATGSVTDPAERQSLWASIAHSDELWQSVPRGISAQKN